MSDPEPSGKEVEIDSDEEVETPKVVKEEEKKEEEAEDTSLNNSDVVTKYQEAARIVQIALTEISKLVLLTVLLFFCCYGFLVHPWRNSSKLVPGW